MLKIAVHTDLKAEEALEKCFSYFTEKQRLVQVEFIAHLHAEQGACDLKISGGTVKGKGEYDSKEILFAQAAHLKEKYGFEIAHYGLHFHSSPNVEVGHLTISVNNTKPVEVEFESLEMDFQVKEFISKFPKVRKERIRL